MFQPREIGRADLYCFFCITTDGPIVLYRSLPCGRHKVIGIVYNVAESPSGRASSPPTLFARICHRKRGRRHGGAGVQEIAQQASIARYLLQQLAANTASNCDYAVDWPRGNVMSSAPCVCALVRSTIGQRLALREVL